ncbi:hypothetical protein J2Y60_000855 [Arcicella sp. BE140]|nr:hypothetical protein [Arcicella sp. BE51]MDR6810670.1 hypothetical protein [Arcicella sp. BE140]MDR6822020.1 hypothetical protein [Arcicella sp. BE139]
MVIDIIDKLSLQGTPSFGALLLLIIATNPNAQHDINKIDNFIKTYLIKQTLFTSRNSAIVSDTIDFLHLVSRLPKEYKVGTNRILLFQTLMQKNHNSVSYKKIRPIVNAIKLKRYNKEQLMTPIDFNEAIFIKDFRTISLVANKFRSVEEITSKMGDIFPINEELLLEDSISDEKPKLDFVEELIDNTNTFHIGALLKRIWSGLDIPFQNVLPSQQPIGGFSDLTNKGSFDRLLISEFAHDDIVFLTRIANNQALYINREIPPQSEELERIILIDVSIKNWGTPKTLAHALLLAIAKHPKSKINCTAYALGDTYQPLYFEHIDEIIKGTQLLAGCLDASQGLASFFKMNPPNKTHEIFFISTNDAIKSASIQKVLSDNHAAINYWMYTDSEGKIDVFKKQYNSRKHTQTLKLPLDELWAKKPKKEVVLPTEQNTSNIENLSFNILFPKQEKGESTLCTSDGQIYHIVGKYLFCEVGPEKGWRVVYDNIPRSHAYEIGLMSDGKIIFLYYDFHKKELTITNLTTKFKASIIFDWRGTRKKFIFKDNAFYLLMSQDAWEITLTDKVTMLKVELHPLLDNFRNREVVLQNLKKEPYFSANFLKNIKKIYINCDGNLSINSHEYILNYKTIQLKQIYKVPTVARVETTSQGKGVFIFPNGHSITVNRLGIITLSSTTLTAKRKHIYIPTIINESLGVGTDFYNAGNLFYSPTNETEKHIDTEHFWIHYLQLFIKEILDYESTHRTISSK